MSDNKLLSIKLNTKEYLIKSYNLKNVEQAVEVLQKWLKKQDHFTRNEYDRKYLEATIVNAGGSIEKAKESLQTLCVFRTVLPQYFDYTDFYEEHGLILNEQIAGMPLPKLTEEHYRVITIKCYNTENFLKLPLDAYFKFCFLVNKRIFEVEGFCAGYFYLINFREIDVLEIVSKVIPLEFKHWATYVESQGFRLKNIIYLTPSEDIYKVIKMISSVFPIAMTDIIQVCKDIDELHKIVPKEILPVEFGGTERSAKDIQDDWITVLSSKEFMDYFADIRNARVDMDVMKNKKGDMFVEMVKNLVSFRGV